MWASAVFVFRKFSKNLYFLKFYKNFMNFQIFVNFDKNIQDFLVSKLSRAVPNRTLKPPKPANQMALKVLDISSLYLSVSVAGVTALTTVNLDRTWDRTSDPTRDSSSPVFCWSDLLLFDVSSITLFEALFPSKTIVYKSVFFGTALDNLLTIECGPLQFLFFENFQKICIF